MRIHHIIVFILMLCAPVFSQTGQDSSLTVAVFDVQKAAIVQAEVEMKLNDDGSTRYTNNIGLIRFSNLKEGRYELIVRKSGFKDYYGEIMIRAEKNRRLEIILEIASIDITIDVDNDEKDSAEIENFGGSRNLTRGEIDSLPNNPTELENELRRIAGPGITGKPLRITVNGIPVDTVPPKEAIRAVRINKHFFSAQNEDGNGGGIEIFTKAELESFSGGLFYNFNNSIFNARNPFIDSKPNSNFNILSFHLRGPLLREKSSIIFGATIAGTEIQDIVNAEVLGSDLNIEAFRGFVKRKRRGASFNTFFDFDVNENMKLFANFQMNSSLSKNVGAGKFRLPSTLLDLRTDGFDAKLAINFFGNNSTHNQTRVELTSKKRGQESYSDEIGIDVGGAFIGGGGQIHGNQRITKFEIKNDTTKQIGKHSLMFGGKMRMFFIRDFSNSNTVGKYLFSGRLAPKIDAFGNLILDSYGKPIVTSISSLEAYRRTQVLRNSGFSFEELRILGAGADQFIFEAGEQRTSLNQFEFAAYIQNSVRLRNDMTASFGVRYENQVNIGQNYNLAPRAGLVWSPSLNQKSPTPMQKLPRISIGTGVFFQRISEGLLFKLRKSTNRLKYQVYDHAALDEGWYGLSYNNSVTESNLIQTVYSLEPQIRQPYKYLSSLIIEKSILKDLS